MKRVAEYWDVYDKNRKRTGKLHKRGIRMQPGEYNIVCEAWIVSGNRLLVTPVSYTHLTLPTILRV